ncbi:MULTISPECIES: hypothetical protein [Bacillus cereus group]|uniref:Uncharacterized protein n=2 Tax=Bacillus cereus group TaxID=86661 RepID=J8EX01_BACCE|nr:MULTISPECIES: hypothetical protein [Bacillus cereus group]EJQ95757.1 hypothetical protein II3_04433 [Bacillus cereus MC67]EOP07752.1 hypothetical protein II1_04179 [Bacillus cereus MC118]MBJ7985427.1 hypothetical protein [Bacillus cereus]OOQ92871.1 hypothetical protein BW898_22295 [Bacillus cereus]TBX60478.1 hypothetical protein E0M27_02610 [Bacillus mycoides]
MKFDFTELERALPKDDYDHFIREFSSELQQSVINILKNENSILSPLAVGTQQMPFKSNIFKTRFKSMVFEKIDNDTIKVSL